MAMTPKSASDAQEQHPQYEERIILFLDFLGFKALVDRTVSEDGFLKRLLVAMDLVGELGADNKSIFKSQVVTQFSDNVVVSYRVTEPSAVFWLLNEIALLVINLANRGFLVRGGVTSGLLHHSDRHVVGPAMNEAYRLESKVAKHPRVIFDPRVLEIARRARNPDHTPREEEQFARSFLTEDSDGHLFFDYVSWERVVAVTGIDNEDYGGYLSRLGPLVREGLRNDDPCVQEKYLWLRRLYVSAIKTVKSLDTKDGYRKANAAMCEEIAALPTYKIDTKLARAAVKKWRAASAAKTKPVAKPMSKVKKTNA